MSRFQVRTSQVAEVSVVSPEGEIDLATIDHLSGPLEEALEREGPVIVDLSAAEFIDSLTIALIVRAARETNSVRPSRVRIVIRSRTQPARVWAITGLAEFVPTFETFDAALRESESQSAKTGMRGVS